MTFLLLCRFAPRRAPYAVLDAPAPKGRKGESGNPKGLSFREADGFPRPLRHVGRVQRCTKWKAPRGASRKGGMEGFAKQRLRRYARRREAVRERDTGAAGGASSTKRRGSWRAVAARGLRGPQPEQGAAAGVASAAAKRVVEMPRTLKDNEALPACRLRKRRAPLNDRGFEGGLPLRSLQRGAGGNGGDRPCLPAPVPVCGPASSGQGSLRNG